LGRVVAVSPSSSPSPGEDRIAIEFPLTGDQVNSSKRCCGEVPRWSGRVSAVVVTRNPAVSRAVLVWFAEDVDRPIEVISTELEIGFVRFSLAVQDFLTVRIFRVLCFVQGCSSQV